MSKTPIHTKVLIIGSGSAGYTAAIYAARANLNPILIQGLQPGGQLTITTEVENYPGFAEITGPDLMAKKEEQAAKFGTKIVSGLVEKVDFDSHPFKAVTDDGQEYIADSIIVATGATARWLGLPSEEKYKGKGVSACATCDGFFFRGKDVVVVGGGNTAVEEALFLANLCNSVTLVHRRDSLRAEQIMQERLLKNPKVKIMWDHVVDEVLGTDNGMTGVLLKNTKTGDETSLDAEGLFVAIGHDPATRIFKDKLDLDEEGYIKVKRPSDHRLFTTETSVPGVFAAGDVIDKHFRQAVTAAGLGCAAALEAKDWLAACETCTQNDESSAREKQHGLG